MRVKIQKKNSFKKLSDILNGKIVYTINDININMLEKALNLAVVYGSKIGYKLKLIVYLIRDYITGKYKNVSKLALSVFIFTIVYIISPVDFLMGYIDDIALISLTVKLFKEELNKYEKWLLGNEIELKKNVK